MRNRLAHGKGGLVQVEGALKQHRQNIRGATRLTGAGLQHIGQAILVVLVQLLDTGVHPGKRFAVRGQHQRIFGQAAKPVDRPQKQGQGVGFRLDLVDTHVGGNARQHHVAADQYVQGRAIEGNMFRCMPIAADAAPVTSADANHLPVHHAPVLQWHRGNQGGKIAGAGLNLCHRFRAIQPVGSKELGSTFAPETGGTHAADPCHLVVGGADPQRALMSPHACAFAAALPPEGAGHGLGRPGAAPAPSLAQPVRQTDVVWVHMRHDHPQNRQAFQFVGEDAFPGGLGLLVGNAAVHDAPALQLPV